MWPWNQTIFDRNNIDTWLSDEGRLVLDTPGKRLLQAIWSVPVEGLTSVEVEVTPRRGAQSPGLGLGRPTIYEADDLLRVWFASNGKPYILQGKDQRRAVDRDLRLEDNRTYRLRLELAGGQAAVQLDGREVLRDKLTFDVAKGCRVVLGAWNSVIEYDSLKITCRPAAAWLARRARLQAEFRKAKVEPGIVVEYFSDRDFKNQAAKRVEPAMYFWWNQRSPAPKVPRDNFSVRFTGKIYVEKAGRYRLHQRADDDGRLWVNGQKILEGNFNRSGEADLKAGFNDVVMELVEGGGFAGQELSWEGQGIERQVIPPELLGH
jgi:hypothetical protein